MKAHGKKLLLAAALGVALGGIASAADAPQMSFFITSKGSGKGGDLGGLKGADAHCQSLAAAAGAGNRTWAAYLSTQGPGAENAKDRIGTGPWYNAKGVLIAKNVAELLTPGVNINAQTGLDEKGEPVGSVKVGANGCTRARYLTPQKRDI